MSKKLEAALAAAGWASGDAADFLEMSQEERQILDARTSIAKAIREARRSLNITQKDLAGRINSTQPRVAKIEAAASDVSFEQLFKTLIAAGGSVVATVEGKEVNLNIKKVGSIHSKRVKSGARKSILKTA